MILKRNIIYAKQIAFVQPTRNKTRKYKKEYVWVNKDFRSEFITDCYSDGQNIVYLMYLGEYFDMTYLVVLII